MPRPEKHVFVCAQSRPPGHPRGCCAQNGSAEVLQTFWQELQKRDLHDRISVTYSGCLGPCDRGANVVVYPEGVMYSQVNKENVARILEEHLIGGRPVESLLAPDDVWA